MAVTRSTDRPQEKPPTTPPFQIVQTTKTPPGAPARARPGPSARTPSGSPSRERLVNQILQDADIDLPEPSPSPTVSELNDFFAIAPFSAPQVLMVLWFSWTTTAKAQQIANMHNRAFPRPSHRLTCWDVLNIENDVAINWHERAAPSPDHNEWSCLCDFGVENCWQYKRDQDSADSIEKLDMAASLWAATPEQKVRCPHGRTRPEETSRLPTPEPEPEPEPVPVPEPQKSLLRQHLDAIFSFSGMFSLAVDWLFLDLCYTNNTIGRLILESSIWSSILQTDTYVAMFWRSIACLILTVLEYTMPSSITTEKMVQVNIIFFGLALYSCLYPGMWMPMLILFAAWCVLLITLTVWPAAWAFAPLASWAATLGSWGWSVEEVPWATAGLFWMAVLNGALPPRWEANLVRFTRQLLRWDV